MEIIKPDQPSSGSTRCSVLDHALRAVHPRLVFYYPERLDADRLRRALGRVLTDFPLFAGTLRSENGALFIDHTGAGARFEVEESRGALAELIADGEAGRAKRLSPRFSLARAVRGRAPLFAAKLSLRRDGCALCVLHNHVVGDLQTLMLFLRAWASACHEQPYQTPLLIPDRDAYLQEHMPDAPGLVPAIRLLGWRELAGLVLGFLRPFQRIKLTLARPQLAAIHAAASAGRRVSQNDALVAHVLGVLRHLAGAVTPSNLCLTVNYRRRVGIPDCASGNLSTIVAQPMACGDEPAAIAAALRDKLDKFSDHADYQANRRVYVAHSRALERIRLATCLYAPGRHDLLVNNLDHAGLYDLRFGQTRGSAFSILADLPTWGMLVHDLPNPEDGVRLEIGLPKRLAKQLRERPDLLEPSPACPVDGSAAAFASMQ